MIERDIPLIAICAPSGCGKTTIARQSTLTEVVSYTTREPRKGEVNGIDYHFVSNAYMEANKHRFTIDCKTVLNNTYAAEDADFRTKDCIVIYLRDALKYKQEGTIPLHIVLIQGPSRGEARKGRDLEGERKQFLELVHDNQPLIGSIITNYGATPSDAIQQLQSIHRQLINYEHYRRTGFIEP
jgi:guanylate kinase